MLTTSNEDLWRQSWSYKDHGKSFAAVYEREHPPGYRWLHESFGTNWRMLEMQAVLGRLQLARMADWHSARQSHAQSILSACVESDVLRVPTPPTHVEHAWYRAYAFVRSEVLAVGWSRDRIIGEISANGVPCFTGSCSEVYLEKAFDSTPWRPESRLPVARKLGETSLSFLVHPTLTMAEMTHALEVIRRVLKSAKR